MLTYGEKIETSACAVNLTDGEAGNLNVQLTGHPHVGTNWMKHLVSTMLFLATNFDTQPFFANLASDRTVTWNITFHSLRYNNYFKHDIPYFPFQGKDGWVPLRGTLSSAISSCKLMAWRDVNDSCITPSTVNLVLPVLVRTRWLLLMRNPINLCISNARHDHRHVFDTCSQQIDALALLAIVRYLWHSEVLPSQATFTWWYEDDSASQCNEFIKFLGYRSDLGVLCEHAVSMNARGTMATVMGLAHSSSNSVTQHSVKVLRDDIELLLSPKEAANLTRRFWNRLPALVQGKWAGTLRKYLP